LRPIAEKFDAYVVTGDLATVGHEVPLKSVLKYIDALPAKDKNDRPRKIVLPGNHDRYHTWSRIPDFRPGCTEFDDAFRKYWVAGKRVQEHVVTNTANETLGIVCADFSLPLDPPDTIALTQYMGCGYADQNAINELVETTRSLRTKYKGIGVVWVIHYSPLKYTPKTLRLVEEQNSSLVEAAQQSDVEVILAGHVHKNIVDRSQKPEVYCAGPSTLSVIGSWLSTALTAPTENYVHFLELRVVNGVARMAVRQSAVYSDEYKGYELRSDPGHFKYLGKEFVAARNGSFSIIRE
jgi:3',5'-cyclic AMP phosphodiesterase CpdA